VIAKLQAKDPNDRFQSAKEVIAALEACEDPARQAMLPSVKQHSRMRPRVLSARRILATAVLLAVGTVLTAQIVIRIRDKEGNTKELIVPEGASVTIEARGDSLARIPPGRETVGEVQRFVGHRGMVWSVAFAPSGRHVLSGGVDGSVRVWNVITGKEDQHFEGHHGCVYAVVVDPKGVWALSADGHAPEGRKEGPWQVCMWNVESGQVLRHLSVRGPAMTCLALTPDGSRALFGRYDGTVWLYDVANWTELNRFQTDWGLWSVAFSSDGQHMLTAAGYDVERPAAGYGNRGPVRIWNLETGKEQHRFDGHKYGAWRAVFSPNGKQVFSAGLDHTIRIWDVVTTTEVGRLQHAAIVSNIALSSDGKHAVSGGWDNLVRFWDVEKRKELQSFEGHTKGIQSVALSPDERYAASGASDGTVRVWRLPAVEKQAGLSEGEVRRFLGHEGPVYSVAMTRDGTRIVSGSMDATARVWDTATGTELVRFEGNGSSVYSVAISADGRRVLSGSGGNPGHDTPEGNWSVCLWDLESGKALNRLDRRGDSITAIAFDADGRRALVASYNGTVLLWDIENWREIKRIQESRGVWSVCFSPDESQALVAGGHENKPVLRLWDLTTSQEVMRFDGHDPGCWQAIFTTDGRRILSTGLDRTIKLWDVKTGSAVQSFRAAHATTGAALSADGKVLVSGNHGVDKTVLVWNVETGEQIKAFGGHTSGVQSVAMSPDGRWAVSGSHDNTVRLWKLPIPEKQTKE